MVHYIDFGIHKDMVSIDWQAFPIFEQYILDTYLFIKMTKQELNEMSNNHYQIPYITLNNISVDNLTSKLLVVIYSGTIRRLVIYFSKYRCYYSNEDANFYELRFIVGYMHFLHETGMEIT